jgi:hypothetical protein
MAIEVPARCGISCGSASRYSPEQARRLRYASATGTLRPVEALDQLRDRVRKAAALPRRGGEAVREAGRSAIAIPRRAVDRLRPGSDPDESAPKPVEPSAFEDMVESIRDNPRVAVAIAGGTILVLTWIGWAIYVASENGASAGLGVMIAWPAMVAGLALVSLPFIGGYMLVRRLSVDESDVEAHSDGGSLDPVAADADDADGEAGNKEGEEEGEGSEDEGEESGDKDEGSEDEGDENGGDGDRGEDEGDEDVETEEAAAK